MLSFVNNIRITTPDDPEPRPLSRQETETILPLFRRRTKSHFDFEEIAKKLAGKGRYACQGDRSEAPYRFNFARTATVTGCPVTASLIALFGDDYLTKICDLYTLGVGKTREQILGDVWHALFSFDDEERLSAWAKQKLRLSDDEAGRFAALAGYVGILFLYLIGLHFLGFVYSTPIVMFLVSLMLGLRHWLISIVCYVLFTLLLNYVAFNFMQIILPTGVLFG